MFQNALVPKLVRIRPSVNDVSVSGFPLEEGVPYKQHAEDCAQRFKIFPRILSDSCIMIFTEQESPGFPVPALRNWLLAPHRDLPNNDGRRQRQHYARYDGGDAVKQSPVQTLGLLRSLAKLALLSLRFGTAPCAPRMVSPSTV